MTKTKDATVMIRLDSRLKEQIRTIAESQDRNLSNWILHVLKKAVKEQSPPKPTFFFDPENHQG